MKGKTGFVPSPTETDSLGGQGRPTSRTGTLLWTMSRCFWVPDSVSEFGTLRLFDPVEVAGKKNPISGRPRRSKTSPGVKNEAGKLADLSAAAGRTFPLTRGQRVSRSTFRQLSGREDGRLEGGIPFRRSSAKKMSFCCPTVVISVNKYLCFD